MVPQLPLARRLDRTVENVIRGFLRSLRREPHIYAVGTIEDHFAIFGGHLGRLVVQLTFVAHEGEKAPGYILFRMAGRKVSPAATSAMGRKQTLALAGLA